jgi:hypothetical protein
VKRREFITLLTVCLKLDEVAFIRFKHNNGLHQTGKGR